MKHPTILIVDDDPLARKVVQATLKSDGYTVLEAENGRMALEVVAQSSPDLILQDLVLPDLDGLELVKQLHALPGAAEIPIFAVSAFPSKLEQARRLQIGFADYILKPIEPSQLLEIVHSRAPLDKRGRAQPGGGRRILVVDDDPFQRKLLKIHLEQLGFVVVIAEDGADGLEEARLLPPDAIVSDILMPRLDGFKFCLAVRQDPQLARIPVVLTSAAFIEEADRRLVASVGATAFVLRTPDLREVIDTLLSSLDSVPPTPPRRPADLPAEEYASRIAEQMSNQAAISADLSQRLEWLEAKLALLAGLAETTKRNIPADTVVDDVLRRALASTGTTKGSAYLVGSDGQVDLRAEIGYEGVSPGDIRDFFGRTDLLRTAMDRQETLEVHRAPGSGPAEDELLSKSGASAMLIVPLIYQEEPLGVLAIEWVSGDKPDDQHFITTTVASQVSRAMVLIRALAGLRESRELLARTIETIPSGIIVVAVDGRITLVNSAAERILTVPRAEITSRKHDDPAWGIKPIHGGPVTAEELPFARVMLTGEPVYGMELIVDRPAGQELVISVNAAPIRNENGDIVGVVQSLSDITDRRRAEQERERLLREVEELADVAQRRAAALDVANHELESFNYSVSHDLRAPLRHIGGFSRILLESYADRLDEQGKQYLRFLREGSQRMDQLIDALLKLSRVSRARMNRQPANLSELAGSILAELQQEQPERQVETNIAPDVVVNGDPQLLRIVLDNFLGNAWKFTAQRPVARIEFGVVRQSDKTVYYVEDNGAGFDMAYADKLFGAFQRLHEAEEFPGTGIGLATVQRIIHRHGGRVWAEGEVDKGAKFYFTLA